MNSSGARSAEVQQCRLQLEFWEMDIVQEGTARRPSQGLVASSTPSDDLVLSVLEHPLYAGVVFLIPLEASRGCCGGQQMLQCRFRSAVTHVFGDSAPTGRAPRSMHPELPGLEPSEAAARASHRA